LRKRSRRIERVDAAIRSLASDMLATMYESNGLGLAAEQVGRDESICVIDVPPKMDLDGAGKRQNPDVRMPMVLLNPEITEREGTQSGQEGCLSFPEVFVTVRRPMQVTVRHLGLDGSQHEVTVRGLAARAVMHECDHLNGVLLVDRMSAVQKIANAGKLRRLKRQTAAAAK
jgi:peptide deformylase